VGGIFQGARWAVAWLGEGAVEINLAFDALRGETFDSGNPTSLVPFLSRPY